MKKVTLLFAMILGLSIFASAQPTELISGPAIKVDKDIHDYGTIAVGANGQCEFKVTNTGTEPLVLNKCNGSCGCTVPTCDPAPIAPGASYTIVVNYDTKRLGEINKSVTIMSNAVNEPVKTVQIKGMVQ
jgi:hypothetical protein